MHEVTKEFHFPAAHRLRFHRGKCRNLHGHTWRVAVTFSGPLRPNGMVVDFGTISEVVGAWLDEQFDHACIVAAGDTELRETLDDLGQPKVFELSAEPTSENLAEFIWLHCQRLIYDDHGAQLTKVVVWEGTTSSATYRTEDALSTR